MQNQVKDIFEVALTAVNNVLKIQEGERVLIVTNPDEQVAAIAEGYYRAALESKARPVMVTQPAKSQSDPADKAVIAALKTEPEVVISISKEKMGKDEKAIKNPYTHNEKSYDHIFHYLLAAQKTRAVWSPGIDIELFCRTVPIDYPKLRKEAAGLKAKMKGAVEVHLTSPAGSDLRFGVTGRKIMVDDGDFSLPGSGGNLPAGEIFISPQNYTANGCLVFDGSLSLVEGSLIPDKPVKVDFKDGLVVAVNGAEDALKLQESLAKGAAMADHYRENGQLSAEKAAIYKKNARHLGEMGIGLNPAAGITGNMLGDEKARKTCHLAIGSNYDEDAPAFIHLDCLVTEPTITILTADKQRATVLRNGQPELD